MFSKSLFKLSLSLYVQQGIKYLLTEGDVIVSTTFASLEDQGMYALSANYGGLIARMVFRPIEDSCRNLFAKLCAPSTTIPEKSKQSASGSTDPGINIKQAASTLTLILRTYSIASLVAFAVGPTAAPLLLRVVAGSRWSGSGAGEVLGTYCYCIPLLALNGVSEAFVGATASSRDLHWQSIWMGFFSAGFAASAYLFLKVLEMGAKGLVLANCVNMAMRIVFNLGFVKRFFRREGHDFVLSSLLPNIYAMGAAAVVPNLLSQTGHLLNQYGLLGELVRVGAIGGSFAIFVAVTEREFLVQGLKKLRA
jgi:oligosaccharide translocation protein RFT1